MKLINIQHKGVNYSIQRTKKETGSNYIFAHLFSPLSRIAIAGTSFKESSTADEIKEWAQNTLNNFSTNFLNGK